MADTRRVYGRGTEIADLRAIINIASHSFSECPEYDRQHQGNDDASRDWKVEIESFSLDIDIARQMPKSQPGQQRQGYPGQDENDADDDEPLGHR